MKKYSVKLYANNTYIGTYDVNASNPEQARELAWKLCECSFEAYDEEIEDAEEEDEEELTEEEELAWEKCKSYLETIEEE